MEIRLLGPLEVHVGGRPAQVRRAQHRAVLAALALQPGRVVSTEQLVADLWGERAPASATGSLQNAVSELRKLLPPDALVTRSPGYRLAVAPDEVDAIRFDRLLAEAGQVAPAHKARLLREALGLWRGDALADVEADFARLEAARLEELRVAALEERVGAELELGRHAALVVELETLVAAHPLRERLRAQLMLALYRSGRQAEALGAYRATRLVLAEELGLDPSPELQELERRMLRQDPELAAPAADPASAAPAAEPAELRLVTVLAAIPPSVDEPEQHHHLLDETLRRTREVLERHGGELQRFGPEGLVAVFGGERPQDDDARRAVLAARELGLPAGVATGDVVRGAGAVVTRAVELARQQGVTLDSRTAALVRTERRFDTPLVGREGELGRLAAALAEARDAGRCHVVTVVGEPGIGKTRLALELARRERARATVLAARCTAHGGRGGLVPVLEAVREVDVEAAASSEPDGELVLARLRAATGAAEAPPVGESYWALRRLLETLAGERPVLLLVDDVQWAEPALLDLVEYLAERAERPLLVLCLARPELERPLGERLALGPLGPAEARTLVAHGAGVDDETAERIVTLAEGNALYVEQLTAFAAEEGGDGLPPTLGAVLAGRLGRLDPAARAVLQRAAVVGRDFSLAAVGALAESDVSSSLLALSRAGFVHPAPAAEPGDDGFTFHHVLLRDAAYESLTKADRAELHERLATWVDACGAGDDAVVGYHLEQAALLQRELGRPAHELAAAGGARLGLAGMRVWRTNDVEAARNLLERAVALLPDGAQRAELLWEAAIALRLCDRPAEADAALADAELLADTVGVPAVAARVAAERTHLRLLNGELALDEAVVAFADALDTLRAERDDRGLGRAEMCACAVHWLAANNAAVATAAERAARHYARAGFSPAGCIGAQAEALFYGATTVEAGCARCVALLETACDAMTEANLTSVLGGFRALAGHADDARALLDRAQTLYEDVGSRRGLLAVWTPLRVEAHRLAGELDEAVALARTNVDAFAAQGERGHASTRALRLAELLLLRGDDEEAERMTALAERDALLSDVLVQLLWRSTRARLLARRGDVAAAEPLARAASEIAALTDMLCDRARVHLALAEVLAAADDAAGAEAEEGVAKDLLRLKGAEGALAGAPST